MAGADAEVYHDCEGCGVDLGLWCGFACLRGWPEMKAGMFGKAPVTSSVQMARVLGIVMCSSMRARSASDEATAA